VEVTGMAEAIVVVLAFVGVTLVVLGLMIDFTVWE